ncbi:hypothetical protein [Niastella sp. OAS944]|uniref:hypothetical protein n=1 Tax=Niastella sp. OAS944 TaxID=2664089 RepID=UPI0035C875A4|nr:hypothetical protein [Chitinophagaceae bacterium OAS944]
MLFRVILISCSFLLLLSCASNGGLETCDSSRLPETAFSVQDDNFIAGALENELTCKHIDNMFKDVQRAYKTSKNKFAEGVFDTVVTYKAGCDTVSYLSAKQNCFPLYLSIQSERMALDNGTIKIGLDKAKFAERFKLGKEPGDVIKITELESANELIFIFSNNRLVRIVYNNLYVD